MKSKDRCANFSYKKKNYSIPKDLEDKDLRLLDALKIIDEKKKKK